MSVDDPADRKIFSSGNCLSWLQWILPAAAGVFFLSAAASKASVPLAEWDHVALEAATSWANGASHPWIYDHPPLYPAFLAVVFKLLPAGPVTARMANAAAVMATAVSLLFWGRRLFDGWAAAWAVAVFLACPVVVQGVQSLDMADTSLLPLAFTGVAWAVDRAIRRPGARNALVLAAAIGLCFWAKVAASIALTGCLALAAVVLSVMAIGRPIRRCAGWLLAGLAAGVGAYLITSHALLTGLWGPEAFRAPLQAAAAALGDRQHQMTAVAGLIAICYSTVRVVAWFSPYVLGLFLAGLRDGFAAGHRPRDAGRQASLSLIGLTALVFGAVHLVIGGTNWGFPRYHAPIVPLVALFAGRWLARLHQGMDRGDAKRLAAFAAAAVAVLVVGMPDPLWVLNIAVKQELLAGQGLNSMVLHLAPPLMVFFGMPLALVLAGRMGRFSRATGSMTMSLVLGAWITVIGIDLLQFRATYRTSLQYGAVGKEQVVNAVAKWLVPGDRVLAAPEFIYAWRRWNVPAPGWEPLRSPEAFRGYVGQQAPAAIVGGLTVSDLDHLRWMLDRRMQAFLADNYRFQAIGTYYIWLRIRP